MSSGELMLHSRATVWNTCKGNWTEKAARKAANTLELDEQRRESEAQRDAEIAFLRQQVRDLCVATDVRLNSLSAVEEQSKFVA